MTGAKNMTLVEKLRADADMRTDFILTADDILKAADEIEEVEALRAELKKWHDFGRAIASVGMNGLTVPLVLNAIGERR
jgi:hypothetical protein